MGKHTIFATTFDIPWDDPVIDSSDFSEWVKDVSTFYCVKIEVFALNRAEGLQVLISGLEPAVRGFLTDALNDGTGGELVDAHLSRHQLEEISS